MAYLTLADEIVLLMLDDTSGEIDPFCAPVAGIAIAGGILMELALRENIDTDLTSLFIVNPKPTGDELLDIILQEIGAEPEQHASAWWIEQLATRHAELEAEILARLVAAGVLREEERRFLWVFSHRAYPQVSDREEREARTRLMSILLHDEVPDPRDTLLLGLVKSAGILPAILSAEQQKLAASRIETIVALEEIGRSVGLVAKVFGDPASIALAALD
jgi:golgi phosphoprotein 3